MAYKLTVGIINVFKCANNVSLHRELSPESAAALGFTELDMSWYRPNLELQNIGPTFTGSARNTTPNECQCDCLLTSWLYQHNNELVALMCLTLQLLKPHV